MVGAAGLERADTLSGRAAAFGALAFPVTTCHQRGVEWAQRLLPQEKPARPRAGDGKGQTSRDTLSVQAAVRTAPDSTGCVAVARPLTVSGPEWAICARTVRPHPPWQDLTGLTHASLLNRGSLSVNFLPLRQHPLTFMGLS